jgi:hypothetical protein
MDRTCPPIAARIRGSWTRPNPVPWPAGLVVKNGSKTRAATSGGMPVPVSLTQSENDCPGGSSRSCAARSSSHRFAVSMVSRPRPAWRRAR